MNPNPYQSCSFRIPKARGPACVGLKRLRVWAKVSHRPRSELGAELQRSSPGRERHSPIQPTPCPGGRRGLGWVCRLRRKALPRCAGFQTPSGVPSTRGSILGQPGRRGPGVMAAPRLPEENEPPLLPTPPAAPRGPDRATLRRRSTSECEAGTGSFSSRRATRGLSRTQRSCVQRPWQCPNTVVRTLRACVTCGVALEHRESSM